MSQDKKFSVRVTVLVTREGSYTSSTISHVELQRLSTHVHREAADLVLSMAHDAALQTSKALSELNQQESLALAPAA